MGCFDPNGRRRLCLHYRTPLMHIIAWRVVDKVEVDCDVNKVLQFFSMPWRFISYSSQALVEHSS